MGKSRHKALSPEIEAIIAEVFRKAATDDSVDSMSDRLEHVLKSVSERLDMAGDDASAKFDEAGERLSERMDRAGRKLDQAGRKLERGSAKRERLSAGPIRLRLDDSGEHRFSLAIAEDGDEPGGVATGRAKIKAEWQKLEKAADRELREGRNGIGTGLFVGGLAVAAWFFIGPSLWWILIGAAAGGIPFLSGIAALVKGGIAARRIRAERKAGRLGE